MSLEALHLIAATGLGAAMGFFGGLFGIGGGIIVIPLLVLAFGMDQPLAQGTALVMMVPNLLVGWWRYQRHQPAPRTAALAIGIAAMLTTWGIAHLAVGIAPQTLRAVFGGCMTLLAARMLMPAGARQQPQTGASVNARWMPLVGAIGGSSMGLLGIGGGLVATPILTGWFRLRQTMAQSLALSLVAPSSVVALATYAGANRVDWNLGLPLALGGLLTISAGVAVAHRLAERRLRQAFGSMLLATGVWLLVGALTR